MSNKLPLKTNKYKISILDAESFVVIRLCDKKQSEVYRGMVGDVSYECFEDAFDFKQAFFDDLCDLEFAAASKDRAEKTT